MNDYRLGALTADIRLENGKNTFLFVQPAWENALRIAYEWSWEPEHKLSLYVADVGLDVSASDAAEMAEAIEAAIADAVEGESHGGLLDDSTALADNREQWELFVAFLRQGGFRVLTCAGA